MPNITTKTCPVFFQIILSSLLLLAGVKTVAQSENDTAALQVKASFLVNFTKFLSWPAHTFSTPYDPFIIGIYGGDPFGKFLDDIAGAEKGAERAVVVEQTGEPEDIARCQILFINDPSRIAEAVEAAKGSAILTVSDDPGFCKAGGMVSFFKENDEIRLLVNMEAVKAANITISSKLLRIAKLCE